MVNRAARRAAVARRLVAPDGGPGEEIVRMQRKVDGYAESVRATYAESARQLEELADLVELDAASGFIDVSALVDILRFIAADHKKRAR